MDPQSIDERIIRLETRIAYQDHLLATLDEVVREFTMRVTALERRLQVLQESLPGIEEAGPADDPPPHY